MALIHLEEKKEQIVKYYEIGLSINKLAVIYKCSAPTMAKALREWGVKK